MTSIADLLIPISESLPDLDRDVLVRRPATINKVPVRPRHVVAQLRKGPLGAIWWDVRLGTRLSQVEAWAYIEGRP